MNGKPSPVHSMAIAAVNGVNLTHGYNAAFTGKKTNKNVSSAEHGGSSTALKSVPVIIMLAMNPATLNSGVPEKYMPMDSEQLTEVVAQIPTTDVSTINLMEVKPTKTKQVLPGLIDNTTIQFKKPFKMEGKNYVLYYIDGAKEVRSKKNIVTDIFLIPDDFSLIKDHGIDKNYPPCLKKFIYHDLGDPENKDYCSAILDEKRCDKNGENSKFIEREVRLPEEIANDLIDLINDDTDFVVLDDIKKMFFIEKFR